ATIAPTHFSWNYTTVLNLVFLGVAGVLYWLYRNRDRLGGGAGLAMDPVCGMQVRTADAPARSSFAGQTVWFCSDRCRERFDADPAHHAAASDGGSAGRPDDRERA
ncbi:MAG TPA: YHS domain-containing protein, partial [Acidimicrobiales bacterium]|nr:YHS domain-containing protein [Acidimicrobiales bacterium]